MIYVLASKWPITWMAIARRQDPPQKKNSSVSLHVVTHLCQFMGQNSEIWGVKKIWQLFDISKILKKLALFGPANDQSVTYSKIQTKVCRVPWGPPVDWFLIKSVNAEYPLSCHKCVEKQTFCVLCPTGPQSVSHHPQKMVPPYSLGTCPPTNPETLWCPIAPSSRKNWFSEGIFFLANYSHGPGVTKIDICQNWPRRVLGNVIRCLEPKFDKKIPMGSVPNCLKEIPACHAIRWFKCKLKPPKNGASKNITKLQKSKLFKRNCCKRWN